MRLLFALRRPASLLFNTFVVWGLASGRPISWLCLRPCNVAKRLERLLVNMQGALAAEGTHVHLGPMSGELLHECAEQKSFGDIAPTESFVCWQCTHNVFPYRIML